MSLKLRQSYVVRSFVLVPKLLRYMFFCSLMIQRKHVALAEPRPIRRGEGSFLHLSCGLLLQNTLKTNVGSFIHKYHYIIVSNRCNLHIQMRGPTLEFLGIFEPQEYFKNPENSEKISATYSGFYTHENSPYNILWPKEIEIE